MTTVVEFEAGRTTHVEQLTVDQYHAMLEAGILEAGAPIELIDGLLVHKDRRDEDDESLERTCLLDHARGALLEPLTVFQYHAMIREGILAEGAPIELIDGLLIRKDRRDNSGGITTVGPRRADVLGTLGDLLYESTKALPDHVRNQLPLTLTGSQQPEPDLAIVSGKRRDYPNHHPGPGTILLVVEVADSSLNWDRTVKLEIYAQAGVPQYWIVNLIDNVVEVHEHVLTRPMAYRDQFTYRCGNMMNFEICQQELTLAVSDFLPLRAD